MAKQKQLSFVSAMPRTSVAQDGSYAEMEFTNSNGTSQLLRFHPKLFLDLMSKTYQLVANQHFQTAQAQGHIEVHPIPVVVSSAQEAIGGKAVILSLKMENGLPAAFALQQAEAEELHRQLGIAVAKAKVQADSGRH